MHALKTSPSESITSPLLQRSLRVKVTLGVVLPLILILGAFTFIKYSRRSDTIFNNLSVLASHSGQVIEFNLRRAMVDDNFEEVQTLLNAIGQTEEFSAVSILDRSGEIIFAPNDDRVGVFFDNQQEDCLPCHRLPADQRPQSVVVTNSLGQRVFRSMRPIENSSECLECHETDGRLLGLLLTDIPAEPMEAAVNEDLYENLLWSIATILVTVIVVNIGLSHFVLRRLEWLANAITGLADGRYFMGLPKSPPDEIGQLSSAFATMANQVEIRELENLTLSEDLRKQIQRQNDLLKRLISAQENERKRVAQELHDELGQSLGALALHVSVLERYLQKDTDQALAQIEHIQALIKDTADIMYGLILDLRPSALDDLGLVAALKDCADRILQNTSITIDLVVTGLEDRLPSSIETSLYRVLQESMTNIVRHAEASKIEIQLHRQDHVIEGFIQDDGKGFDMSAIYLDGRSARGLGLMGIQERIAQCGGTLHILTEPGHGTLIKFEIPFGVKAPTYD